MELNRSILSMCGGEDILFSLKTKLVSFANSVVPDQLAKHRNFMISSGI